MRVDLGGDRIGSGNKMKIDLRSYNRSTHDLSYLWRSTMATGTLVPFMSKVGLPGDTFDIDVDAVAMTKPTIGPLYGSQKVQVDIYECPIRLYQGQLHNNKLNIGMYMNAIKLPQIVMEASDPNYNLPYDIDNCHTNPSSLLAQLGIRGNGLTNQQTPNIDTVREYNAVPLLAYWDIYKNYYANKQEGRGYVIHTAPKLTEENVTEIKIDATVINRVTTINTIPNANVILTERSVGVITVPANKNIDFDTIWFYTNANRWQSAKDLFLTVRRINTTSFEVKNTTMQGFVINAWGYRPSNTPVIQEPQLVAFNLENIDNMREDILTKIKSSSAFTIDKNTYAPYGLQLQGLKAGQERSYSKLYSQEGLGVKTYQSDQFNNWVQNEWINGDDGVNTLSAVDTSSGEFTIDSLIIHRKVHELLLRIATSGGTYDDWLGAVYDHNVVRRMETPRYLGGLSKEIVFEEVVSQTEFGGETDGQPLGTLAGRGVMSSKKKGGKITVKIDEPCYIIGIISITPRIDYSQGNEWDVNLKTMDDFHKPGLDEIGFQDLMTDQMAWWSTRYEETSNRPKFISVGKQPAWLNYMTAVNRVRGNFAIQLQEGHMVQTRRYERGDTNGTSSIKDLSTYIDPKKFNYIFAQTSRDAQNYWMQMSVGITARRKMSAKLMPNL